MSGFNQNNNMGAANIASNQDYHKFEKNSHNNINQVQENFNQLEGNRQGFNNNLQQYNNNMQPYNNNMQPYNNNMQQYNNNMQPYNNNMQPYNNNINNEQNYNTAQIQNTNYNPPLGLSQPPIGQNPNQMAYSNPSKEGLYPNLDVGTAVFILIMNIFFPGLGTMIMGCFSVNCCTWNCIGLCQMFLSIIIVGWIWAIITGVMALDYAQKRTLASTGVVVIPVKIGP